MRTWKYLVSVLTCLLVVMGLGPSSGASAEDHQPSDRSISVLYRGAMGIKEPEGFGACSYTNDFAEGQVVVGIASSSVSLSFRGSDRGVRAALSCPTQGWSGDLHWTANYGYHHNWPGSFDGSGAVDEIKVSGLMVAEFTYEWRNCSGNCPAKQEVERYVPVTFYGQFQDNGQTQINGSIKDDLNRTWGRWSATAVSAVAAVKSLQPDVLVNGEVVADESPLKLGDELSLRRTGSGQTPRARVTCQVGAQESATAEIAFLLSDELTDLINPAEGWNSSPQMLADWEAFCINEPRAADETAFGVELSTGAAVISVADTQLPSTFETGTVTVHTTTANSFALGHSPETSKSVVAAYNGALELVPANEQLDPFTLEPGQVVVVEEDKIGPVGELERLALPVVVGP